MQMFVLKGKLVDCDPVGQNVYARRKTGLPGKCVTTRICLSPRCPGTRLVVKWSDGEVTAPCTMGMTYSAKTQTWEVI